MVVNDQIVARLGEAAGAPTGSAVLVDVPVDLIAREPGLAHFKPGIAHGTRWMRDCGDAAGVDHVSVNRERFASLALLFGWIVPNDQQYIYENSAPRRVWSVDHGHFFPQGPDWTTASLATAGAPAPFDGLVQQCGLTSDELERARPPFRKVTDVLIAAAVAAPPDSWGLSQAEREAVAEFIASRRDGLFA
jgi:hypothetical protein